MEPGETDEDVANVTIEDVSDDIVRQRVDQALAREEAAAELIEVSFVHDAPDYTIELYNEGVHVCDLVAEGVFETRTQVGRCWSEPGLCGLRGRRCKNGRSPPERGCCG